MAKKKTTKQKDGAWFVKRRGSYLPSSPSGVLLAGIMLLAGLLVISMALDESQTMFASAVLMVLSLVGLGAVFTWIASVKS